MAVKPNLSSYTGKEATVLPELGQDAIQSRAIQAEGEAMRRMRRIFVAMTAGVLAFAEILGYEVPETEPEPESEPIQETFKEPAVKDPYENINWSFAPDQPHTHTEMETDTGELPYILEDSGKQSARYFLWLSPVFEPVISSIETASELNRDLVRVQKRGHPVLWQGSKVQGRWQQSTNTAEMFGMEGDLKKLHDDLESCLHLPADQVRRLIAVLLAGQSVMVGGDWSESFPMLDLEQLRTGLREQGTMSPEEVGAVMAIVSGENAPVRELVKAPQTFAPKQQKDQEQESKFRIPSAGLAKWWIGPVQQAIPRLPDTLTSLRTFSEEELKAFGMSPLILTFTPPPWPAG